MLLDGTLDAVFSAHPPAPFEQGTGHVRTLIADHRRAEEAYHAATDIFPIMHVVAVKRAIFDAHPWIGPNLMSAFEAARRASLARLFELTASRFPLPWAAALASEAKERFGELFPYGVEANRATLEAFLRFAHAQGLADRVLAPEELFASNVLESFRI
jgi:4,5-dihydroxyphthalate decarboxylase